MSAYIDSIAYEIVSSQVFLWRHRINEYTCGRVYTSTDIVLDAAVSVAPIFKKYVAPDSCGDSSCGPNLQEPALSSKGTGKKLQHETWHLPLLQYMFYCNTHHYNFSFLQSLRVGTVACHVKLAVPNTTAAVGLLRCWYGIWNYRPLGDVKRYQGAQLPIFNLGFRRKFRERDKSETVKGIGPGAKLFWFKLKMHTYTMQ